MKLKVVIVDLEIRPRVKKWGLRIGVPLAVIVGGSAIAWAGGLHPWSKRDTLTADDLNGNFTTLHTEITALQGQVHPASAFRAVRATAFNTPSDGSPKTVAFDNVIFDLGSEYNATSGIFVRTMRAHT